VFGVKSATAFCLRPEKAALIGGFPRGIRVASAWHPGVFWRLSPGQLPVLMAVLMSVLVQLGARDAAACRGGPVLRKPLHSPFAHPLLPPDRLRCSRNGAAGRSWRAAVLFVRVQAWRCQL